MQLGTGTSGAAFQLEAQEVMDLAVLEAGVDELPPSNFDVELRRVRRKLRKVEPKLMIVREECHPGCGDRCKGRVEARNAVQALEKENYMRSRRGLR